MKRLIFTLIFASLLGGYAFAYDFSAMCESGQTLYYNITSSTEPYTVEVTREYTSSPYYTTYPTGNLTIPSSVTYNSITYSVTSIGYCAFNNCSGLTSVTIPYYVTSIGGSAFGRCYGLTSVNFNGTNGAAMGDYSSPVFYGCTSLATLNIGGNVTNIPDYAFYDCSSLNAVYYMGTVEQWCGITFGNYGAQPLIYAHNLYVNSSLVTDLVIPETVTEIKERAFCGATCLTSVTIGNSVASIGNYAFSGCSGLTGELTIPNSVTSIGAYAFYGCNGLATINFNAINCTSMSEYEPAFEGCTSVTILNIGENVTNIPAYAFRGFSGVTGELTIPNSVTSIGDYAL